MARRKQMQLMTEAMLRMKNIHHEDLITDMTPAEAYLLAGIAAKEKESTKVSDICSTVGMHAAAVSRLMNGLEERQLIERKCRKGNRRVTDVSLTEKGKQLNDRNQKIMHDYWDCVFSNIPEKDFDEMLRILQNVMDSMEQVREVKLKELEK